MSRRSSSNPSLHALGEVALFGSCTPDQLATLMANTDVIRLPAGSVLAHRDRPPGQFVGVLDGYVEVRDDHGIVTVLGPGDHIGGHEIAGDLLHEQTFVAMTPVRVVIVFAPAFRWAVQRYDGLADSLARSLRPSRDRRVVGLVGVGRGQAA